MTGNGQPDPALWGNVYQVLESRRNSYDTMMWQVPALGLAAQSFLMTIALASGTAEFARYLSASLSMVIAIMSVQLMSKHRFNEVTDSRLLEELERQLHITHGGVPLHAPPLRRCGGRGSPCVTSCEGAVLPRMEGRSSALRSCRAGRHRRDHRQPGSSRRMTLSVWSSKAPIYLLTVLEGMLLESVNPLRQEKEWARRAAKEELQR